MKGPLLGKIDLYIIKKFMGTFVGSIILIISICIVFDVTEHIDEFIKNDAPLNDIIFRFYLNWIPYFINLFSNLFVFIAVIFFTSKLAFNSEIIAILAGGMSFNRLLRPYIIAATFIATCSWLLSNIVIPHTNKERLAFQNEYISKKFVNKDVNIHRQLEPGLYMYMSSYNVDTDVGYKFSLERFEDQKLVSKLVSEYIKWDKEKEIWTIKRYYIRDLVDGKETLSGGREIDTTLTVTPADFKTKTSVVEELNYVQLNRYIAEQRLRGVSNLEVYQLEKYKRTAFPFSAIILTIIGVSIASRKVRGGTGVHILFGFLISFTFIMLMQVSAVFSRSGFVHPMIAVWIPNILFSVVALILYRRGSR